MWTPELMKYQAHKVKPRSAKDTGCYVYLSDIIDAMPDAPSEFIVELRLTLHGFGYQRKGKEAYPWAAWMLYRDGGTKFWEHETPVIVISDPAEDVLAMEGPPTLEFLEAARIAMDTQATGSPVRVGFNADLEQFALFALIEIELNHGCASDDCVSETICEKAISMRLARIDRGEFIRSYAGRSPDLSTMNNEDRAELGERATCASPHFRNRSAGGRITDTLSNIMHLCNEQDIDFDQRLEAARDSYCEEIESELLRDV